MANFRGSSAIEREPVSEKKNSTKMRGIQIKQLDYGYVVDIDCHSFAIESKEMLIEKLIAYINDPAIVEAKWFDTMKL